MQATMRTPKYFILLTLLPALLAAGCGGAKFTRPHYETIYMGMPQERVETILGKPASRQGPLWIYFHEMPFYSAAIRFDEERKVLEKSWTYERDIPAESKLSD
jgi:hypothetical protein